MAGAFYPPRLVISDINTLATLPDREFRSSLGEVVKYGVIRDARLFHLLETQSARILKRDKRILEEIVIRSASIKAAVVSRDEFETKGERMILNFGHTFGHGFEQALSYKRLLHGEAVAVGMVAASGLARVLGLFSKANHDNLIRVLESLRLPVSLKGLNLSASFILSAMARDKKKKGGKLQFILPVRIGKVIVKDTVPDALIQKSLFKVGAQ